ncbi:PQQ-dependent sugar dehydrogenase [Arcticibacterium luteifluviistationis]|uniref:Cytochrome C n=1 Tax=Arcticibacterium luteifluviistationis TaxID=1784714 RepID=A0A2Z4GAT1_9BACT|nr:PQQ-dependent sugar dehydrogenase [Arcticibacterium luteifluviistationis]AWV98389.1 cytochrome C [Arcticibacterium luteifluviistationis]
MTSFNSKKSLRRVSFISLSFLFISSLFIQGCKTGTKGIESGSNTTLEASINQGRNVFENSCAACHSFERDGIGPNLAGLTRHLSTEEIIDFISNPKKVIDSGNKRAVNLQKKYKSVMPSYSMLGKEKLASLVSFIHTYKDVPKPVDINEEGILEDPIPHQIEKSNFVVNLEFSFQIPASNEELPNTRITKLWGQPNTNEIYVCDINGKLYRVKNNKPEVYMDVQALMPNFKQRSGWATGFGSFAFHPDFENNGLLYTTHTEPIGTKNADYTLPEGLSGQLQWIVQEWKTDNPKGKTFKGSNRELFRIDMATQAHGMQNIDFNPTAQKGDKDYGKLYIGIGDGGAVQMKFPEVANGKHSPWGSILRIDPTGTNSANGMYGIPSDNPFVNITGEKVAKEVYANGFRNPHRFSWTNTGKMISANIGQHNIEAVYVIKPGANHGWPTREGTFGINTQESVRKIYKLTEEEMKDGVTYPTLEYDHDEGNAVCGGFVYTGSNIPSLTGMYIFGDILKGKLYYADESQMEAGRAIDFKEMRIALDGKETTLLEMTNNGHAKLRIGKDANGDIYLFSMNDGKVYQLVSEK